MMLEKPTTKSIAEPLSWSHCIPTVDRVDILKIAISCSLAQIRPPKEIIVIDASENWLSHKSELTPMFEAKDVRLVIEPARVKSSAVQRNQALEHVSGDIILFTDDDSLLFPDFATEMLALYENDLDTEIAAVGGAHVQELPALAVEMLDANDRRDDNARSGQSTKIVQKQTGSRSSPAITDFLERRFRLWPWIRREILMMSTERMFVPYDKGRPSAKHRASQATAPSSHTGYITDFLPGFAMSARVNVARAEPFNAHLLAYCPLEDLDTSYRYGRHGLCVIALRARLNHFEIAASRITRQQASSLGISNMALFIHTHSNSPWRHRLAFGVYVARRLLGETIKDLGARRFNLPQAAGVLGAVPRSFGIFRRTRSEACKWYVSSQRKLLTTKRR